MSEIITSTALENRLLARARFRHMQVLVAVAELGSIRRAAAAIQMAQPAVTKVLQDVEQLLGLTLFHRHARGVTPTADCTELLFLARQTVGGVVNTASAVAARRRGGEGTVRVVGITAALNGALAVALPAFNRRHPKVHVQVDESDIDGVLMAIARGEADLALVREPAQIPEGWNYRELTGDELVIACGTHHPLARKRKVSLEALKQEQWLPGHAAAASRKQLQAFAGELGASLNYIEVATRLPTFTLVFLRQTNALTLLPYSVVRPFVETRDMALVAFDRPMPFLGVGTLLPARDASAAAVRLAEFLLQFHSRRGAR